MIDDLGESARALRALADETRLRILHLISEQELTVGELTEALNMGQSRVSGHLAILKEAGLIQDRREGKRTYYGRASGGNGGLPVAPLVGSLRDARQIQADREALGELLRKRAAAEKDAIEKERGALGTRYLPGRTWEGLGRALLHALPKRRTADLGIGDGDLTLLLARAASSLIAVDICEEALAGAEAKARKSGLSNVEFRKGDVEDLPIGDGEVDLAVLSQVLHEVHDPERALGEACRILAKGGRILVLDLKAHRETWVRERLSHLWLGFKEDDLKRMLAHAGLVDVVVERAARDPKPPHFISILATGVRP